MFRRKVRLLTSGGYGDEALAVDFLGYFIRIFHEHDCILLHFLRDKPEESCYEMKEPNGTHGI